MGGVAAEAATIVQTVEVAPTGAGTPFVVRVSDTDLTANVAMFHQRIYFNENQVDISQISTSSVTLLATGDNPDLLVSAPILAVGDYVLPGYTHYVVVVGIASDTETAFTLGSGGALYEVDLVTAAGYNGIVEVSIQPSEPEYPFPHDYLDPYFNDLGADYPNNNNPAYSQPVLDSLVPNYYRIGAPAISNIQLHGANFYNGPAPAPHSNVLAHNPANGHSKVTDPTYVSTTHLIAPTAPADLTNFNTPAPIDIVEIHVDNGSGHGVSNVLPFYIISTDEVWVDKDWTGTSTGTDVSGDDSGWIFGVNAFATIQNGVNAVNVSGTVNVLDSTVLYEELVTIGKANVKIEAVAGAVIAAPATAPGASRLISVNADGVEIRGLEFKMNSQAGVGVFANNRNGLTVEGCDFEVTAGGATSDGTITGTWGPKGVYFYGNTVNSSVTLKGNTFSCPGYFLGHRFSYAMHVERGNAQIGGLVSGEANNSSGAYRDLSIRYASGDVVGNDFAMNVHAMNAQGPLNITGNFFLNSNQYSSGSFDPVDLQHEEAALSIQANTAGHTISVSGNHFVNSARGVWSGGSRNVEITGNFFTPADSVHVEPGEVSALEDGTPPDLDPDTGTFLQKYTHIIIDSSNISSNGTPGAEIGVVVKGNTFNSSANPQGGVAINFRDPFDGNFANLQFGAPGEANSFDGGITEYVNMADDFDVDINVVNNLFDGTLGSNVSLAQGWAIEDKIHHKIDDDALGFARVQPSNVFVTPSGKIQNAINAADGGTLIPDAQGDTINVQNGTYAESNINVHKRVALLGESEGGTVVVPGAEGADGFNTSMFVGPYQHGFILSADKVKVSQFTLDGMGNPNLTPAPLGHLRTGIIINEPLGNFGGATISDVTFQNIMRNGVQLRTDQNPALVDPTLVNVVEDCHFDTVFFGYGVYAYHSNANVIGNTFDSSAGVLANGNASQAPVVDIKGNTVSNTIGSGFYLVGAGDGSIVGGPNPEDRNVLNYADSSPNSSRAMTVSYSRGSVTVQNNEFNLDNADTGIRMFNNNDPTKPVQIIGNEFLSANSLQVFRMDGTAIFMTNMGSYFGDGDRGHAYAVIRGNLIDGFVVGVDLNREGGVGIPANHEVEATIGGILPEDSNDIVNCSTGIRVYEAHDNYTGYRTSAEIIGNNTTISGHSVAINVDGGVAVITGNSIEDNGTAIQVHNTGIATIGDAAETDSALANTMVGNGKHFSFESAAAGQATVNGFDAFDRDVDDMLGVVDVNAVTGKTYITETMTVPGTLLVEESGFVNLRSQINPAVQVAEAEANTVNVGADPVAYVENIMIYQQLLLNGAGIDQAIISGDNGGASPAAIRCMTAAGVIIQGFTITREGNTVAEWGSNPVTAGIAVQGGAGNLTVRNNKLTGNRTGIDINKSSGNVVMNNIIDFNRTGMILRNECPDNIITGNFITNNWTKGVTWLITGLVADSTNTYFYDNEISGNWYGDIQSQGTDGGYKQFALNWFGHSGPITVDATNYGEPGYGDLIPAAFGGTDGPPAVAAPNISGAGLHLVDFTPYLNAGDQDPGTAGFQSDYSILNVTADAGQAGTIGRVGEAVQTLQDGLVVGAARQVNVWPGVYTEENSSVNKSAIITGVGADRADAILQPATAGSGIGLIVDADNVAIDNLTMEGYAVAIQRTGAFGATSLTDLAINDSGHWSSPKSGAVHLAQPADAAHSAQSVVQGCTFNNNTYAALQLLGSDTRVANNQFSNMDYLGVFAIVAGNTKPVVDIDTNTFTRVPAAVRLYGGDLSSEIHGNTFDLGMSAPDQKVTLGVQLEMGGGHVHGNTFTSNGTETVGSIGGGNLGVWVWNNGSAKAQIIDNTFTSTAGTRTATAIHVVGKREGDLAGSSGNEAVHGSSADIRDNTINNYKYGVRVDNANSSSQVASADLGGTSGVGGNDISGCEVGLLVEGSAASAIVQNGLASAGFHGNDTGIQFDAASVAISSTVINGNDTGVHISGDAASSSITDSTFTAGSDPATRYVVNTSADDLDLSSNTFAGDLASALDVNTAGDLDKLWVIEDLLTHKLDDVSYGFLNVNTGNVFATHAKSVATPGVIGRGVVAASAGDTVLVQESQPGAPYVENSVNVDKHLSLVSAEGIHAAEIQTASGLQVNLPAASGATSVDGFRITGTAAAALSLNGSAQVDDSTFALTDLAFSGLPTAAGNVALRIQNANLVGNNTSGLVQNISVTGSADGILITDSRDIAVEGATISGNSGTGISVLRTFASQDGSQDISIADSSIINNGSLPGLENDQAYGIVLGSDGIATLDAPFGINNSIVNCDIKGNGGAGIVVTGQNVDETGDGYGDNNGVGTYITYNTIENNGVADTAAAPYDHADGIKINSSRNVELFRNIVRENVRHGILVTGQADEGWAGDHVLVANHITENTDSGLTLQVAAYQSGDPKVVADANWWGHVYGPHNASIPALAEGRGQLYDPQSGEAVLDTWYGQRSHAQRWFALNDRDGDGIYDADEDHSLDGVYQLVPTAPDTMVETDLGGVDTDGDGYEDGFEIAVGTDPNLASSTPFDLGYLVPNHLDNTDADNNGYKDWYDTAIGSRIPKLGDINNDGALDSLDTALFRSVMIETTSFKTPNVHQDAMDLNRDGVITNVDTILMRRAAAETILLPF